MASIRLSGVERPRLHLAGEPAVERGHRYRHLNEPPACKPRQNIEIAHHQRRFGHDRGRVAEAIQHLQHAARDLPLALDRLIGIGVRAEHDRCCE